MWDILKYFSTNVYFICWAVSAGMFFLFCRRDKRVIIAGAVVFALTWIVASRPFGEAILRPLEQAYTVPSFDELREAGVNEVVVLTGGGYWRNEEWLYSRSLALATTRRMMGALEIASKLGPEARLIYSGAGFGIPVAGYMAELTKSIQPERVVLIDTLAGRTVDHPRTAGPLIKGERFIIVTTAYHIPRSMKVFRDAGYDPIAYPVDYQYSRRYKLTDYFPSAKGAIKTQAVLYELFAYLVYLAGG